MELFRQRSPQGQRHNLIRGFQFLYQHQVLLNLEARLSQSRLGQTLLVVQRIPTLAQQQGFQFLYQHQVLLSLEARQPVQIHPRQDHYLPYPNAQTQLHHRHHRRQQLPLIVLLLLLQ